MRKLLILAYHFPPSGEVAGKPTARLVRHLPDQGWEAVVVAPPVEAASGLDPAGMADVQRTARIERTGLWAHPFDGLAAAKLWKRRLMGQPTTRAGLTQEAAGAYQRRGEDPGRGGLRRSVREWLSFPDLCTNWIVPASRKAASLMASEHFDAVLSVSPPPSAQLAALLLRRRHREAAWFAQFHDPWSQNPFHAWSSTAMDRLERRAEAAVVRGCDRVLCATEEATGALADAYPDLDPGHFLTLQNGFDPVDFPAVDPRGPGDGRLTFTYTGSLYGPRDPSAFLHALARLVASGRLAHRRLRVRLVGSCDWARGRPVRELAGELGLAQVVEIEPPVPYPEALGYLAGSDVLLLFAEGQPAQVPAKLFEYLHVGRNILAFCSGATARIVAEAGAGRVVTSDDPAAIEGAILDWAGEFERGGLSYAARPDRVDCYRADILAVKLARALDSAIESRYRATGGRG